MADVPISWRREAGSGRRRFDVRIRGRINRGTGSAPPSPNPLNKAGNDTPVQASLTPAHYIEACRKRQAYRKSGDRALAMQRHLHSVGIFVLVSRLAGSVQAQTLRFLAAFDDSLSDSGNLAPVPGTAHRHQLYHRSRSGRTRDRRAGLWRIGHEFARRRIEPCLGRRVWQDRVLGSGRLGQYPVGPGSRRDRESRAVSSKNAIVRPVSMPGLATCLPARAAVATNISPRFKAVKKKPEVLAKAKIQLGQSVGPVSWAGKLGRY